jgi:hypothetical protein
VNVDVYRNLRTGTWSVRDRSTGRVIAHPTYVMVSNVDLVVQPAGRERVRHTGRKNVHAFVRGTLVGMGDDEATCFTGTCKRAITYNPHLHDGFVYGGTGAPIRKAQWVELAPTGAWVD